MRLTVGGVLILLGVGAVGGFVVSDGNHLSKALTRVKALSQQAGSLVGLSKPNETEPKDVALPPLSSEPLAVSTDAAGLPLTEAVPLKEEVPVTVIPEPTPQVVAPKAVKKVRTRKKKPVVKKAASKPISSSRRKSSRPKKPVVKSAPPAAKTPNMVGTYVSLELITGRSVQGILESKTATHYVLNVPGLGPLEYPIENVKSILPAQ